MTIREKYGPDLEVKMQVKIDRRLGELYGNLLDNPQAFCSPENVMKMIRAAYGKGYCEGLEEGEADLGLALSMLNER